MDKLTSLPSALEQPHAPDVRIILATVCTSQVVIEGENVIQLGS